MFKLFRLFAAFALLVLLGVSLNGCATEQIVGYGMEDEIPNAGTTNLRFDIRNPQRTGGQSMNFFMGENPRQVVGNLFLRPDGWDTEWNEKTFAVGTPITITTENAKWYRAAVCDNGNVQYGNAEVNEVALTHFIQEDPREGIFALLKTYPDTVGTGIYQYAGNTDRFVTTHYVIVDPERTLTNPKLYGTQTAWNNAGAPYTRNDDYGIWELYTKALKSSEVKVVSRNGNGTVITNRVITVQTEAMGTPVALTHSEVVSNGPAYFAGTNNRWFNASWLSGQRITPITINEAGEAFPTGGAVPVTGKLIIRSDSTPAHIPADHVLMAVFSGHNDDQPFIVPRVGDHWEANISTYSGVYGVSVWDTSADNETVIKSVRFRNQAGVEDRFVHMLVTSTTPEGEPLVGFGGVLGADGTLIQGPDNRDGIIGEGE